MKASWRPANWFLWLQLGILLLCPGLLSAGTATAEWNPVAWSETVGYRLYLKEGVTDWRVITNTTAVSATFPITSWQVPNQLQVTAFDSDAESVPIETVTIPPPTNQPPTGTLGFSAPTLSATNLLRGQTLTATARFTNGTSVAVSISEGWLTARQPGASNQSGPFDDFFPGMPGQTVAPGGVVSLTASWVVRADAPFGTWQAHLAVKSDGVFNDGPNTPFNVISSAPQAPPSPTGLRIQKVTQTRLDLSWDGTLTASTEVERNEEQNGYRRIATVAPGRQYYSDNIRRKRNYDYRVRNVTAAGVSDYSNEASYQH